MDAVVKYVVGEKEQEFEVKGFHDMEGGQVFTIFKSEANKIIAAFITARVVYVHIPQNEGSKVIV